MMYLPNPSEQSLKHVAGAGASVKQLGDSWQVRDAKHKVTYHVLKKGHPAYPGFVAHELIEEGTSVTVKEVGKYRGDKKAYSKWLESI